MGACSASDKGGNAARVGTSEQEGPSFFEREGDGSTDNPTGASSGLGGLVDGQAAQGGGGITVDSACIVHDVPAELVEQPVDIILLLDNSGSMGQELKAVEDNINLNFASILINSEVDYRVILISRHRDGARTPDDGSTSEEDTSVCVTTPLSSQTNCDGAPQPVFSERFFQFNTKVDSVDSFDAALATYAPPILSDYAEDDDDDMPLAPLGWSAWLRPGAKKVFLELTDDNEDESAAAFTQELVTLAPEHFGTDPLNPSFVFHSIVGLAEKAVVTDAYLADEPLQELTCTGNGGDVTTAGTTYQELSRLTGGLRFPICQFDGFDVVFRRIADDVILTSNIACDFPIPPPPVGETSLDLEKVAIQYAPGVGAAPINFGQAPDFGACQPDAFYISNDRLTLCPAACSTVRANPMASMAVLFTCESTIIVPR